MVVEEAAPSFDKTPSPPRTWVEKKKPGVALRVEPKPKKTVRVDETYRLQETWKPYNPSLFLPGRVVGQTVQFLLDTGCTTNLIAKHVFDRLPKAVRGEIQEYDSYGSMADGTRLPFYGMITIPMRLRNMKFDETFVICGIKEDLILGMPFLVKHHCAVEFGRSALVVEGQSLMCTDRQGRNLSSGIQVVRKLTVPPTTEMAVRCKVTVKKFCPLGIIEGGRTPLVIGN